MPIRLRGDGRGSATPSLTLSHSSQPHVLPSRSSKAPSVLLSTSPAAILTSSAESQVIATSSFVVKYWLRLPVGF